MHWVLEKNKYTWCQKQQKMLSALPAYAVYSAMHFKEYSTPEPTAEQATVSGSKKMNSGAEDEDWVFL